MILGLIIQLKALRDAPPKEDVLRQDLLDATRSLLIALETPGESLLQTIVARVALDLKLFEALTVNYNLIIGTAELAKVCNLEEVLISRILRFLASFGIVKEVGEDSWSANKITNALSKPGLRAGFLANTDYCSPVDATAAPFQKAHKTDLPVFRWMRKTPAHTTNFAQWVDASPEGQYNFLDSFPFEQEVDANVDPYIPLFVDIGGGSGHQCVALKTKLPNLVGRIVLQDLQAFIDQAIAAEGIETIIHDFKTE
ncbi:MAG: hypothetical protein Q9188_003715 [Gyalolechia gomerana]